MSIGVKVLIPYSNEYRSPFASDEYIFSLCTVTPVLVNMEMVLLSEVFPTLINDVGKPVNVSTCVACFDNCGKGSRVTFLLCMCHHLLLQPFCLMSVRWAYTPLFYCLCSRSVRQLLSRTSYALCLHAPPCCCCVFLWTSLVSCLLAVTWLPSWMLCKFRMWCFMRVGWCLPSVLRWFDCGLCRWCFATLLLYRL